jgi:phage terminase large subunit-like protein
MERWKSYAVDSAIDHFTWWCENYAVQSIAQFAGKPLILEPWQMDFMGEALSVNKDYTPYWKTVVLVVPRKNGKTSLLAAYADYHADQDDGQPEVLLCAASDKQAGRLFESVVGFNRQSAYLSERFNVSNRIGEITRNDEGATILRMSSDPKTLHGYNPSLVIVDELHAWTTPKLATSWGTLITGGGARDKSQVFVITTAGEARERETGILGHLIDGNEEFGDVEKIGPLTISRNHGSGTLVYNYSAQVEGKDPKIDRRNFAAIRAANPASWITDDYLKQQMVSPELSDGQFLQLHACVWADDEDVFISPKDWNALGDGSLIPAEQMVCIGMDGSRVYDTTVVAWASKAEDGRIDVDARIFSCRHDAPHHEFHEGNKIQMHKVEDFIFDRFNLYEVTGAGYDPRYLDRSAELIVDRLPEAAIIAIEPTSRQMRDALATLYRGVMDGTIRHRGDSAIAAHIAACKGEQDERGWVVRKKKHSKPIDAVMAMAMAVFLVNHFAKAAPSPGVAVVDWEQVEKLAEEQYGALYE